MSLLFEIYRYLRATGMPETKFGRMAVRDPRFVHDLRNGRMTGPSVERRVRGFMRETRP